MALYCYRCPECGRLTESTERDLAPTCPTHIESGVFVAMRRSYRDEGVSPQVANLKREREAGGPSAVRDMFLPTAKDYESPSDPDGSKGLSNWAETHAPASGNKRPAYPDMPKKSFAMGGK
jgi:hypothetical protein